MLEPSSLVEGTLRGTLSRAAIERAVAWHWEARTFAHQVSPAALALVAALGGATRRYRLCDRLHAELLYGREGAPGCLLVTTPAQGPYDRSLRRFLVEPHVHDSAHMTVVTAGRALFALVVAAAARPVLITLELGPGALVLYPAGTPHTFLSDEAFQVASLQAVYREPEGREFATPSPVRFDALPRVRYEDYRDGARLPVAAGGTT